MDMLTQGFIAAATIVWLLSYIGFRRVFGYAFLVDVIVTGGFLWMFAGSYAGMMTGLIAGLMVSVMLKIGRWFFGYERLTAVRQKGHIMPTAVWKRS